MKKKFLIMFLLLFPALKLLTGIAFSDENVYLAMIEQIQENPGIAYRTPRPVFVIEGLYIYQLLGMDGVKLLYPFLTGILVISYALFLGKSREGVLAFAFFPAILIYGCSIYTDLLASFYALLAIHFLLERERSFLAGALFGIGILVNEGLLLFIPAVLWFSDRQSLIAGVMLFFAPYASLQIYSSQGLTFNYITRGEGSFERFTGNFADGTVLTFMYNSLHHLFVPVGAVPGMGDKVGYVGARPPPSLIEEALGRYPDYIDRLPDIRNYLGMFKGLDSLLFLVPLLVILIAVYRWDEKRYRKVLLVSSLFFLSAYTFYQSSYIGGETSPHILIPLLPMAFRAQERYLEGKGRLRIVVYSMLAFYALLTIGLMFVVGEITTPVEVNAARYLLGLA